MFAGGVGVDGGILIISGDLQDGRAAQILLGNIEGSAFLILSSKLLLASLLASGIAVLPLSPPRRDRNFVTVAGCLAYPGDLISPSIICKRPERTMSPRYWM